jgi:hypothetical protein
MSTWAPIICEWQSWAQGGYGIAVFAAGLAFAIAVMIYAKWTGLIPYVVLGALVLYYGVPILEDWFGFAQDCATVRAQFAQEEGYARNTEGCEANLFNVDAQTGEDCGCNGESATPQCVTYEAACEQNLAYYQSASNTCTCGFADAEENTTPSCTQIPAGSVPAYTNLLQMQCQSVDSTWDSAPFCTSSIPQAASWIYPVPNGYEPVVPHAYYTMQTVINNTTGHPVSANWYEDGDDVSWLFLNGQQVKYNPASNSWTTLQNVPIVLQPGNNTVDITILNDDPGAPDTPNPSGTISEIVGSNNQVISATGGDRNSWYEVAGPPSTTNPPPPTVTTNCYTTSCVAP